jgi:DNA-binding transcriptional regulator GbsR (MarR family)
MQPTDAELHYVEEFGLFWEQMGLPRMTGRILGWLLICDPPEQTMTDLTEVLQASKSSISTGTRMLIQFGFIERISLPGERKDYYVASGELSRFATSFIEEELLPRVRTAQERIKRMEKMMAALPESEQQLPAERIDRLKYWLGKGENVIPLLTGFLKL